MGDNGEQLGIIPFVQALQNAREAGVDLVEVAPNAVPPVCRIMDYGKYKYEQAKREKEARKNQKNVVLREVRMKPKIDDHDIDFKTRIAGKLLEGGDKVKVTIMFRGREVTHPQIGRDLLDRVAAKLKDTSVMERGAAMEGRFMSIILAPAPPKPEKPKKETTAAAATETATAAAASQV